VAGGIDRSTCRSFPLAGSPVFGLRNDLAG
jgi:hypothetical protein